jgi:hypothetical protein
MGRQYEGTPNEFIYDSEAPTVAAQQCGLEKVREYLVEDRNAILSDGIYSTKSVDDAIACLDEYLSHAGLVERLQAGVPTEPGCSHPIWSDVEKADATMAEAATTISALSARTEAAEARVKAMEAAIDRTLSPAPGVRRPEPWVYGILGGARSLSIKEAGSNG